MLPRIFSSPGGNVVSPPLLAAAELGGGAAELWLEELSPPLHEDKSAIVIKLAKKRETPLLTNILTIHSAVYRHKI